MKTCNLAWIFGGRNQKYVHNFSRKTVEKSHLNYEGDGRVILNVMESDNTTGVLISP
jgi:hypothetical protein